MTERRLLLMDANVLIDYAESDLGALTLVSRHLARVHALDAVLDEVEQLGPGSCRKAEIEVLEPETDQLIAAGHLALGDGQRDRVVVRKTGEHDDTRRRIDGEILVCCGISCLRFCPVGIALSEYP